MKMWIKWRSLLLLQFASYHWIGFDSSIDEFRSNAKRFAASRKERLQKCFASPTWINVRGKSTGQLVAFIGHRSNVIIGICWKIPSAIIMTINTNVGWLVKAIGDELKKGVNPYVRYKTKRILHIKIASIRSDYRRHRSPATLPLKPFRKY